MRTATKLLSRLNPLKLNTRNAAVLLELTEILILLDGLVIIPFSEIIVAVPATAILLAPLSMTVVPSHSLANTCGSADPLEINVTSPLAHHIPELPCVTVGPAENVVLEPEVSAISAVVAPVTKLSVAAEGTPLMLA